MIRSEKQSKTNIIIQQHKFYNPLPNRIGIMMAQETPLNSNQIFNEITRAKQMAWHGTTQAIHP